MTDLNRKRAYLDYAATAPFDTRLSTAVHEASWANANSLYEEGRHAHLQLEDARQRIARALHAHSPAEIIFTSGGTEGDNMAVCGLRPKAGGKATHVVVSAIEHDAVLNAAKSLKSQGLIVELVQPDDKGIIHPAALESTLSHIEQAKGRTGLVAIQLVNNEVGSIQPIETLANVAHGHGSMFFCDAVQGLGKVEIHLENSGVDAMAFSAHKIGALKGCGALYVRRTNRIKPLVYGGGQESGLRSGTSNVLGACAFAAAVEYAVSEREDNWARAQALRTQVLDYIQARQFAHQITPTLATSEQCVPHILSLLVDGLEGETMVLRADNAGIALSSGSACSTGNLDPSHVLLALDVPKVRAYGAVRLSFGPGTTDDDLALFLNALEEILR